MLAVLSERQHIVRILITVSPLMYREVLALTVGRHRPEYEVMFGAVESLDGEVEDFGPDLLICSDRDGFSLEQTRNVLCRIELLYNDSMGARVSLDGKVWVIEDISTEDLLGIIDRVRELNTE